MNVVSGLVAGRHLEFLVDVHRQHVRRVHAILLIEHRLLRGRCAGLRGTQTLGDVEHNVLQTAARPHHHILQVGRAVFVLLDAERIFGHVNALHVRGCAIQFDRSCDLAFGRRAHTSGLEYNRPNASNSKIEVMPATL